MPGDEHKIMNRAENRARSAIISSRTTSRKEVNKMAKCFSCPGDSTELSKETKQAHTTQTKPGPSHGRPDCRPPTTTRRSRSG